MNRQTQRSNKRGRNTSEYGAVLEGDTVDEVIDLREKITTKGCDCVRGGSPGWRFLKGPGERK